MKLSKKLKIGGALAAEQVEGRQGFEYAKTVWDTFFEKKPDYFYDQKLTTAIDFVSNYKEDILLFKQLGLEQVRISISWAKLFPAKGKVSKKALAYYHNLLDEFASKNIEVFLTLYHFDTPIWVFEEAELIDEEFIDLYCTYAKFAIKEFGLKVSTIVTFNEPVGQIERSYLRGNRHWPLQKDFNLFIKANRNVLIAHKMIAKHIHENYPKLNSSIVLNLRLSIPEGSDQQVQAAAKKYDLLFTDFMLFPVANNQIHKDLKNLLQELNVNFPFNEDDLKLIKNTSTDLIGINYYRPRRIILGKASNPTPYHLFDELKDFSNYKMNSHRKMEIYPEGMELICRDFIDKYHNHKFYISENGMGIEEQDDSDLIEDDYRINFLSDHLQHLQKGIDMGANCVGYHIWSPIDNWSWANGFKNRYGLISVNLKTMKRTPKKSFQWYQSLIKNREL